MQQEILNLQMEMVNINDRNGCSFMFIFE